MYNCSTADISLVEVKRDFTYNGTTVLTAESAYPETCIPYNTAAQCRINNAYRATAENFLRSAACRMYQNAVCAYQMAGGCAPGTQVVPSTQAEPPAPITPSTMAPSEMQNDTSTTTPSTETTPTTETTPSTQTSPSTQVTPSNPITPVPPITLPAPSGMPNEARAVVANVRNIANVTGTTSNDTSTVAGTATEQIPFNTHAAQLSYGVTMNENGLLSTYCDRYTYTGGAHGNTCRTAVTWSLRWGTPVQLCSLFPRNCDYCALLQHHILAQADAEAAENPGMYFENYRELIVKNFNACSYNLSPDGVEIFYQQYEIAPYSTGIVTFTTSYDALGISTPCALN